MRSERSETSPGTSGWLSAERPERRRELYCIAFLLLLAIALRLPAIGWGLPTGEHPQRTRSWVGDELGGVSALVELSDYVRNREGNPQYPMFHYLLLGFFSAPYLLFLWLTGGLTSPGPGYPFGLSDPVRALRTLLLISRGVSVAMAAGTGVLAFLISRRLWDRTAGLIAGVSVALMYPMFYYGHTSNVDTPATFWALAVIFLFVGVLEAGLSLRRALALGGLAGLAVATKDQNAGVLLLLPLGIMYAHLAALRREGKNDLWSRWKAPLAGLFTAAAVYLLTCGVLYRPAKFADHVSFITRGSARFYRYSPTLDGYLGLGWETMTLLAEGLNWIVLAAALVGILFVLRSEPRKLLLLLPMAGFALVVLLPIRHVTPRFLMSSMVVLACFAGRALAPGWRSSHALLRVATAVLLVVAWGWQLVLGADLTYVMRNDPRHAAADWLALNSRPGDRIEVFGISGVPEAGKPWAFRVPTLPRIPRGVEVQRADVAFQPGSGSLAGDFVLLMGDGDLVTHNLCPKWVFEGLKDGSMGYVLGASFQTRSLFEHPLFAVNPKTMIFVRKDRAQQLAQPRPPGAP